MNALASVQRQHDESDDRIGQVVNKSIKFPRFSNLFNNHKSPFFVSPADDNMYLVPSVSRHTREQFFIILPLP